MSTHAALCCYKNSVSRKEKNKFPTLLEPLRWRASCRSAFGTSPDLATRPGDPNPPSRSDLPPEVAFLTAFPLSISILTGFACITLKTTERVVLKSPQMDAPPKNGPGGLFTSLLPVAADPPRVPGSQRLPWEKLPEPGLCHLCLCKAPCQARDEWQCQTHSLKQSLGPLGACITSEQRFFTVDVRRESTNL